MPVALVLIIIAGSSCRHPGPVLGYIATEIFSSTKYPTESCGYPFRAHSRDRCLLRRMTPPCCYHLTALVASPSYAARNEKVAHIILRATAAYPSGIPQGCKAAASLMVMLSSPAFLRES